MRVDKLLTAFVRQLLADPDDRDTPLVMADWLQDNGEESRAALIRACAKLNTAISEGEFDVAKAECKTALNCYGVESYDEFTSDRGINLVIDGRGFVVEISCPVNQWVEHGPAWVRRHPIRSVRFIDRYPRRENGEIFWQCEYYHKEYPHDLHDRHVLPAPIASKLKGGRRVDSLVTIWQSVFYTRFPIGRAEAEAIEEAIQDASQAAIEVAWETEP